MVYRWSLFCLVLASVIWSVPTGQAQEGLGQDPLLVGLFAMQTASLPPLPEVRLGASDVLKSLEEKPEIEREEALLSLLTAGHFPDFLRRLKSVQVEAHGHSLRFWVMPDYLSLGHDDDFMLVPLNWISVRRLAHVWGFFVPTPKMVDAIFASSARVIWPKTFPPGPEMSTLSTIVAHNQWIEGQRYLYADHSVLTAGHKKDIVVSRRLYHRKDKIAIYGWQNIWNGEPIQPLSLWHGERYADYSHGVRMVAPWVVVDGSMLPLDRVLRDPDLSRLLSDEGPVDLRRVMAIQDSSQVAQNRAN